MQLAGKRIVLTGAASGIGRALLGQLHARGARLLAADRDADALRHALAALAASLPTGPLANNVVLYPPVPLVADLSQPAGVDALFAAAVAHLGGVDVLVANAGFAYYETLPAPDWAHLANIFNLNVLSPLYSLQKMRELNPTSAFTVVMTASAMAKLGVPGYALYGATKAALDRFADAFRHEVPPHQRLCLVYPIATRTNFFRAATAAGQALPAVPFPAQNAEAVARATVRGLERGQRSVYPSGLFRAAQLLQGLFQLLGAPYQWYYARALRRWAAHSSNKK